jgi:NADP-dependent 3-hydroxy acid dehydrogenase YdfG
MKIIITGANKGLGLQLCKTLIQDGHQVYGLSKNVDNLENIKNPNFQFYQVDIRNHIEIENVVNQINYKNNSIDILINNAAVYLKSELLESSNEQINSVIDTNVKGTIFTTRAVLSKLLNGPGKILMINSVAGTHGIKNESIYSASKFALNGFSDSLQIELKQKNIFITNIYPGGINSTLWNDNNQYPGDTHDLLSTDDICSLVKLIISVPNSIVFKNLTIYPSSESH